jgi:hypothetical protein
MRRTAWVIGLSSASIALGSLCSCSWEEIFPPNSPTLPNAVAVDRALRLCSLSEGDQPYHLILDISPPAHSATSARSADVRAQNMHAQVEIFWLNPITYRTVILSRNFSQTRIVNGSVIEEHNTGDFFPRWIQNFVDAILDPVPRASVLRKIPGSVPIGVQSHACISHPDPSSDVSDETVTAEICFQDAEPRIASGVDFTRSVWFDDFAPFGKQQIARTLVNDLPANVLVRGQVRLLEPFPKAAYPLLKAMVFTPPAVQIRTTLVSASTASSMLDTSSSAAVSPVSLDSPASLNALVSPDAAPEGPNERITVYIRTDRTGRVREAYRDSSDQFGLQDAAVDRALALRFKPLVIDGVPQQMEAPLVLPPPINLISRASH